MHAVAAHKVYIVFVADAAFGNGDFARQMGQKIMRFVEELKSADEAPVVCISPLQ